MRWDIPTEASSHIDLHVNCLMSSLQSECRLAATSSLDVARGCQFPSFIFMARQTRTCPLMAEKALAYRRQTSFLQDHLLMQLLKQMVAATHHQNRWSQVTQIFLRSRGQAVNRMWRCDLWSSKVRHMLGWVILELQRVQHRLLAFLTQTSMQREQLCRFCCQRADNHAAEPIFKTTAAQKT